MDCGKGVINRFRECDSPAPHNGGDKCPGSEMEFAECRQQDCIGKSLISGMDDHYCQVVDNGYV